MDRIAEHIEALSQVADRFGGTEGERAMLDAVRKRTPEGWLVRVEGFVDHTRPDHIAAAHVIVLVLIGLAGVWWPGWALLGALIVTLSLLGEATGRAVLLRSVLMKSASYNLVAREARPDPRGSVVLVAPLDVSRWQRPRRSGLRLPERAWQAMFWAALGVTGFMAVRSIGEPLGPATLDLYLASLALLATTALLRMLTLRANRDGRGSGGGPAVLLELMERLRAEPLDEVEVWVAFTGCSHAYQGGIRNFLNLHRDSLRDPVLVLALDEPERPPLTAVISEGPVFAQFHRATGPALVERLRWAGIDLPEVRLYGATDAREAQLRGYRALALSGGDGPASADAARRAADLVEIMIRWFATDVAEVDSDRGRLAGLAQAVEAMRQQARTRRRRWRSRGPDPESG